MGVLDFEYIPGRYTVGRLPCRISQVEKSSFPFLRPNPGVFSLSHLLVEEGLGTVSRFPPKQLL